MEHSKERLKHSKETLDEIVRRLRATIQRARKRAAELVHSPHPADGLRANAQSLLEESAHLSRCCEACQCANECFTAIQAYQRRDRKTLPLGAMREAKQLLQKAKDSVPKSGYSTMYDFPETCRIRVDIVSTLLRQCDTEMEKSIAYTKDCITKSNQNLSSAVRKILEGDFSGCEELLSQAKELDMVMTPDFWGRWKTADEISCACR